MESRTHEDWESLKRFGYLPVSDDSRAQNVNRLGQELSAHEGELVFVVSRRFIDDKNGHFRDSAVLKVSEGLGIITPPFLDIVGGNLEITTPKYSICPQDTRIHRHHTVRPAALDIIVEDGNIGSKSYEKLPVDGLGNLLRSDGRTYLGSHRTELGPAVEVVVGNDNLRRWMEDLANKPHLMRVLGWPGISLYETESPEGLRHDVALEKFSLDEITQFRLLQEQLGRDPIEHSPEMTRHINELLYTARVTNLMTLKDLNVRLTALFAEQDEVQGSKVKRDVFPGEGPGIERQYQRDDADMRMIRMIPLNQRKLKLMGQIGALLDEAQELGLYVDGQVLTTEIATGVEINFRTRAFLQSLHQRFEIPLPRS